MSKASLFLMVPNYSIYSERGFFNSSREKKNRFSLGRSNDLMYTIVLGFSYKGSRHTSISSISENIRRFAMPNDYKRLYIKELHSSDRSFDLRGEVYHERKHDDDLILLCKLIKNIFYLHKSSLF